MRETTAEVAAKRERAVAECIADVKAIIGAAGVSRPALERVKAR